MAKSLRSKKVQANKRVMREKAKTIDMQKHEEIAQKLHQTAESFNMSKIAALRKSLYKKGNDAKKTSDDVDMVDNTEMYKKILGVKKTIQKPKRTVPGPSTTVPAKPSRGTEFLKNKSLPYRPRQYQRSHNRLAEYDPTTAKSADESKQELEDAMAVMIDDQSDEHKQYQKDIKFMENFHKNLMDHRARLRDICPPAKLYFLDAAGRLAEEEKKAKDFALEHYKTKGSKATPAKPTDTITEEQRKSLMEEASEADKGLLLTPEEAIAFYQREADGSTVIDDVKVYLPASYGRFGFEKPSNVLLRHLNDVANSKNTAQEHKVKYGVFRKDHEREFHENVAAMRKRITEYQTANKITKQTLQKKEKPLGLQMRDRINKMRGDFMSKKISPDNSSLRNASIEAIHNAKAKADARAKHEGRKIQKTIQKLNQGRKHKYGREKNNLDDAAARYINKEFATAMTTRNIMYGNQ